MTMSPFISARDVADRLGLRKHAGSWRGTCPACGYRDTFAVLAATNGRARLFCASCNDRDALADAVARVSGGFWQPPPRQDRADNAAQRERKQAAALRLWNSSEPAPDTLADTYLAARGLAALATSSVLGFRSDTPHPEGGSLPAMIALVSDATGKPIAVHRTFLARDGRGKADVTPSRATLGPYWGGAVHLDPVAPELAIGEGLESSASAGRLLELPAWAALSAGNLAKGLVLPPEVRSVTVAADHDGPGREAAHAAAERWRAEGRRARIARPDSAGCDFNDVLLARQTAEAAHA